MVNIITYKKKKSYRSEFTLKFGMSGSTPTGCRFSSSSQWESFFSQLAACSRYISTVIYDPSNGSPPPPSVYERGRGHLFAPFSLFYLLLTHFTDFSQNFYIFPIFHHFPFFVYTFFSHMYKLFFINNLAHCAKP